MIGRSLSLRGKKDFSQNDSRHSSHGAPTQISNSTGSIRHRFSFATLKLGHQSEALRRMHKLIKAESRMVSNLGSVSRDHSVISSLLTEWGDGTLDPAVDEIASKLGDLMIEMSKVEGKFSEQMEEYRNVLKQIRNTENSVQPAIDNKNKIADEVSKLKVREPASPRLEQLEQELVRAEAQSLVAEAQLSNITRAKFKEAYILYAKALFTYGEKQAIIARHANALLTLLDETPIVPGETHHGKPFDEAEMAYRIVSQAEIQLRGWNSDITQGSPIISSVSPGPVTIERHDGQQVESSDASITQSSPSSTPIRNPSMSNATNAYSWSQSPPSPGASEVLGDEKRKLKAGIHSIPPGTRGHHPELENRSYAAGSFPDATPTSDPHN